MLQPYIQLSNNSIRVIVKRYRPIAPAASMSAQPQLVSPLNINTTRLRPRQRSRLTHRATKSYFTDLAITMVVCFQVLTRFASRVHSHMHKRSIVACIEGSLNLTPRMPSDRLQEVRHRAGASKSVRCRILRIVSSCQSTLSADCRAVACLKRLDIILNRPIMCLTQYPYTFGHLRLTRFDRGKARARPILGQWV
jgi:hypothetical protein